MIRVEAFSLFIKNAAKASANRRVQYYPLFCSAVNSVRRSENLPNFKLYVIFILTSKRRPTSILTRVIAPNAARSEISGDIIDP